MKTCTKCSETKPTSEFYKRSLSPDGLQPCCKACAALAHAKWRAANPDKVRAYCAKWAAANRDKILARVAKWQAANPDKVRASYAKWAAANREARCINEHNRRARKREAGGKLSKGIAERLFKLQKGACPYCGEPLRDNYHLDHRMPLALGGTNKDDNMQLLCPTCNLSKGAKHPDDFERTRGIYCTGALA